MTVPAYEQCDLGLDEGSPGSLALSNQIPQAMHDMMHSLKQYHQPSIPRLGAYEFCPPSLPTASLVLVGQETLGEPGET